MTIWEQADAGKAGPIYCWMLGRAYATRREMERWGWKWISGSRGCRGVFVTNDPAVVRHTRDYLRLDDPKSNGSHARVGASMFAI